MKIKYCAECEKYTLKEKCSCGNKTKLNTPPRFIPKDKYEKYRRELKWNS